MNNTHHTTVNFNRWLTRATASSLPSSLNTDGSQRPFEVHFGNPALGLGNLPPLMGSLQTLPDLVRQSLATVSQHFAQEEGRQLRYNLITVRAFTPDTQLIDYDCLLGSCKSSQTVWYTHSGALSFGCVKDTVSNTNIIHDNDSVSDPPTAYSSRIVRLFRKFGACRLSHDQSNHTFEGIHMRCPMRCQTQSVKTGKYLLRNLFEPKHQGHMFHMNATRYDTSSATNKPICIQVIFRQLEHRRTSDSFDCGALVLDGDGASQWSI